MPRKVLDQDAGEALERAADRAMHHDGLLLLAIGIDVERAESFRQIEVDLRGAALLVAPDRVAQNVFELRPIERAFARVDADLDAIAGLRRDFVEQSTQHTLGMVPHRISANALFRTSREL